ncbi:hypothetical protein C8R46DRAFT_576687 [Mycena filopes]|nr:hypothetical protein C8R46DRAFT_576687 [Mycena filopes]
MDQSNTLTFPRYLALSPLFLCQICQRWREIALSTPQLWSAIAIAVGRNPTAHLELLETWLARSGNCPLSFSLSDAAERPHHLQAALLHLCRWQYVVLDLPFEQMTLIQGEMPLLRGVTLTPRPGASIPLYPFQHAPLPWAQLTHFEAHRLKWSEIVDQLNDGRYILLIFQRLSSR